jgi:hypothetical protein
MIPSDLPPQFMCWRLEQSAGTKKPTKVPCLAVGMTTPDGRHLPPGTKVDPHNPTHWVEYETAHNAVVSGVAQGVAFVLTEADSWFFLDLDNCFDADRNEWIPEASAIFQSFAGAWGEVSQSGSGLHILGHCDHSKLIDRRNKWDGWKEFYFKDRFIAFGSSGWSRINGDHTDRDFTDQLLRIVPQREFLGDLPEGVDPTYTGPENDDDLISMALRSSNTASAFGTGVTFQHLWEANVPALSMKWPAFEEGGDFDHSSADMALMSHLAFWTGKDMPRMDRLFRRSGLMREKYEKRSDYRSETVQKAARLANKVYDKPRINGHDLTTERGEVFLSIQEMQDHFDGCVYIRDLHRIFVPDGALLKPEQFNATYGGHWFQMMPDGTKPTRKAFEAFTECPSHRFPQAVATTFQPKEPGGKIIDNRVNIYVKPEIRSKEGDITPLLDFMNRLLPNENDRNILMNYMASVVQNPGVKFQWAPVLQGTEGNGKTLLASCMAYAIGDQYVHMPRASQLAEKFNGYLEGKMLIVVEEIHMGGRREMLDELKPLVTNMRIEVRAMQQEKRMIDNVTNWFFCTNHRDAVLKSKDDRRYAIFYTAQQAVEDLHRDQMNNGYFPQLYGWLQKDGYSHVAHWLENMKIDAALDPAGACHRAPSTTSTDVAIAASIGPIEQEVLHAVETHRVGFRGDWISSRAFDELMREKNMKISRNRISNILISLGYDKIGRASKPIVWENGERPVLWYRGGDDKNKTDNYISKQGWPS